MPTLRPFQREDVDRIKAAGLRVLIASAPGTGKTCTAIMSLTETPGSFPALVVCPASVTRNWKREFKLWAPGLRVQVLESLNDRPSPRAHVVVTSWSTLDARQSDLLALGLRSVVADEAHLAVNPDAQRSQALHALTRDVRGLLLLTGTPVVNGVHELDALNALFGRKPLRIRRLLEEAAPDVPPKSRAHLHVRMLPQARQEYDRAVADFEQWLRRKKEELLGKGLAEAAVNRALAAEAFVKFGYLRRLVGQSKVHAAAEWVSRMVRNGEPVVVFLEHQEPLEQLSTLLQGQRIRHVVLDGATSTEKRQAYVDGFQANTYPVILCTKAGKEGITLHAARHLLILERYLTCADEEQAEDRIRRIGQKHATTIWLLHAEGSLDDRLDEIVQTKRRIAHEALGGDDIEETEDGALASILSSWSTRPTTPARPTTTLGLGELPAPLPLPRDTHGLVFSGTRWTTRAAATWARMNGFLPSKKVSLDDRFKLVIHPVDVFKPGGWSTVRVAADVRAVVGKRLPADAEARVRKKLAAA